MMKDNLEVGPIAYRRIRKVGGEETEEFDDYLAVEEPLEIQLAYQSAGKPIKKSISVTMRTPGHDQELAAGFLFTEGIIHSKDQITAISPSLIDENRIIVTLSPSFEPQLGSMDRNFYTTSSCGVCGKASIDAIKTKSAYTNVTDDLFLERSILFKLPGQIALHQHTFETTGGLHASALFDLSGDFRALREDVGRHNALDKLVGAAFMAGEVPLSDSILLLSGRASFELIQKAAMAGIRIVAAIGAPSSLAAQLAEESGMTLIGFLKKDKFNVYTGAGRVL